MIAGDPVGRSVDYELGHSEREFARLDHQAQIIGPFTRQIFREAGIGPGMSVLDVGSGNGQVAVVVADLVGPAGEVVGTDRAAAAVSAARVRAQANGLHWVSFREGDPAAMAFERPFDAIVGRYVLMFQADPAEMLRGLARHLRPGGVIAFHEPDWAGARSVPRAPSYDRCCQWIVETFRRLGAAAAPWLYQLAELARTMLPEMQRVGVVTSARADIETLAERLQREVAAGDGIVVGRSEIGAWSRV
jgi:ubiquinone/menaquinone biosynthesis C-methylase UbiE